MEPKSMEESVGRIKQTLRWFPGIVLGLKRRVGKTSALLEVIHDDHKGEATVYCTNRSMEMYSRNFYKEKYPKERVPNFASQVSRVRGQSDPIFADEWWYIPTEDRRQLLGTGRLAARIGTEFGQRDLDSATIRFTDEELDCLDAMFDVLVTGGGNYTMLGLPETVKIHRDLRRKFKEANERV
jgi:hypothetical protein